MTKGRIVVAIIVVLAVIILARYPSFVSEPLVSSDEAKARAMAILMHVEDYDKRKQFYDALADLAHLEAFETVHQMQEDKPGTKFDEDRYLSEFFERVINHARDQGWQELVRSLIKFRDEHKIPRPGN
jgi:hypothetical protein